MPSVLQYHRAHLPNLVSTHGQLEKFSLLVESLFFPPHCLLEAAVLEVSYTSVKA